MQSRPDLTVYYDGYCPICSREISNYKRLKPDAQILWHDLAAGSGDLQAEKFDLTQALKLLHIKDATGTLHIGLAAHLLLWQHLPGFRWRTRILGQSTVLLSVCSVIYLFFTRHRPGLWRRTLTKRLAKRPGSLKHSVVTGSGAQP